MSADRSSGSGRRHDNIIELAAVRSKYAGSRRSSAASGGNNVDKQRDRSPYAVLIVFPTDLTHGSLMVGG